MGTIRRAPRPALALLAAGCSSATIAPDAGLAPDGATPAPDAATTGVDAAPDAAVGPVLRVFADDYRDDVSYASFGGSTGGPSIVAEPHAGATALRIEVPAAGYTGGALRSATPVDLSEFTAVTFWARASRPATLNVAGLGNDAATDRHAAEATALPLTTTWTRHLVPIPLPARLSAEHGLFHLAEGSDEGAYTIWLDDIQYEVLADGALGAPQPAIATETVSRPIGATFPVNGASVTYLVDGAPRTIAASRRYFTFTSTAPAVATVDDAGVVTAHAAGTTTITARLGDIDAVGTLTFEVTAP